MLIDIDWQDFEMEEGVTMQVKPLDFPDFQRFMSLFKNVDPSNPDMEGAAANANPMTNPEMGTIMKEVLPKYVRNLTGIQIKVDGEIKDATMEDLVGYSQLLLFAVRIMLRIISISNVGGGDRADVKKLLQESLEDTK